MFRQILIPTEKNHIIKLPPELYGKQVEIIAIEIKQETKTKQNKQFLDDIVPIADFPSINKIRSDAWPMKW